MFNAYLSNGVIIAGPKFEIIYRNALRTLREERGGAVIFTRNDDSIICAIWRGFGKTFIWRKNQIKMFYTLLKETYMQDDWGKYCWDCAGLGKYPVKF